MTIVINEADRLTKEAQAGLRRTMEKYSEKCRLILCCENLGQLIPALKSRCLLVRNSSPTQDEIFRILTKVTNKENISGKEIEREKLEKISQECNRNLRRGLLRMQNLYVLS